jgi:hypothetical protein
MQSDSLIKHHKKIQLFATVLFILGTLDPMEGSVLILVGALIIALMQYLQKGKYWKWFVFFTALIIFGVFFLFYLSSLGGFGGSSRLSIWCGLTIIPYPIGWLGIVVLLWRNRKKIL